MANLASARSSRQHAARAYPAVAYGPHGMTPDEVLDVVGPSWSAMTPAQRERYGSRDAIRAAIPDPVVEACADLLRLALEMPKTMRHEGLEYVAERFSTERETLSLAHAIAASETLEDEIGEYIAPPADSLPTAPVAQPKVLRLVR